MKSKFFDINPLWDKGCVYSLAVGERSNGKSYGSKLKIIENSLTGSGEGVIIRRYDEDYRLERGPSYFEDMVQHGWVTKLSEGKYDDIVWKGRKWFFAKREEQDDGRVNRILAPDPFCYALSLTSMEHDKGSQFPTVTTVVFEEFITRNRYLNDEFALFMNTLSTIIRDRDNVRVIMLGNTVNKFCPYFNEMGLKHIKYQKQGVIDIYEYGDTGLSVAVQLCDDFKRNQKKSNKYFAFDNPKLKMITQGAWEIDIYPHLPRKYTHKDIRKSYFIEFDNELLQADIVKVDGERFTFIHRKTTPVKNYNDILFTPKPDGNRYHYRRLNKPVNKTTERIWDYFKKDKVFYQDNEVGEIVANYLKQVV